MLVTLTYQHNKKKTGVNFDEVKTYYPVYNKEENSEMTKILFKGSTLRNEDFINVTETVEEIHNIINEIRSTGQQVVDFTKSVENTIQEGYVRQRRERDYNRQDLYQTF